MPTVRLEFELDSEVYPELYAALSALRSTRARSERMRQLAAAGLVWEKVRLHGASAGIAPAAEERTDLVTRADVTPPPISESTPLPAIERRTPGKRARAASADKRRASDVDELIDLAINAEPTPVQPVPSERRRKRPSREELEQVMRELPVLMDVVADVQPLSESHEVEVHEETGPWSVMNAYPDEIPVVSAEGADDDNADLPDATLHVTALSHKPATRSRLMRMKERGLFKNG